MIIKKSDIAILGCGWLGLPLAEELVKQGYLVNGSTTDSLKLDQIRNVGARAFIVSLNPELNSDFDETFLECDVMILNFPPLRRDDIVAYHRKQYEALIQKIEQSTVKNILMVSSTSVYPSTNKVVFENDAKNPEKGSGEALLIVEDLLRKIENKKTTIVRFGGLIGYDRNPARFLAGKTNLKDGHSPVNLIHRDDCIAIISRIIKQEKWGEIYNACCDEHPSRKEFYTLAAQKSGFAIPEFVDDESPKQFKIIDSLKLKKELAYTFKYKSPLDSL